MVAMISSNFYSCLMQLNVTNVIKVILDHFAHISKETYALARQATGRTLRIHFRAQARFVSEHCRELDLLDPAPYSRHV
jgi:hypothetical protein